MEFPMPIHPSGSVLVVTGSQVKLRVRISPKGGREESRNNSGTHFEIVSAFLHLPLPLPIHHAIAV